MRTIRQQLLTWLLGGMLIATLLAALVVYFQVREEANELFDYQLQQIASSFPGQFVAAASALDGEEVGDDILVQVWSAAGALSYSSAPAQRLSRPAGTGFSTQDFEGEAWRVFESSSQGHLVQVAQPLSVRQELAAGLALRSALPFLLLIPALAGLIGVVVKRSLQPLEALTNTLRSRSAESLLPLSFDGLPPELQPTVAALNGLLARLERERALQRDFITDAAHELRTPLTALKLQMQLVERAGTPEQQAASLAKLQPRIDRATHLVQQLLVLARSEGLSGAAGAAIVDASRVAREVAADMQPLALSKRIDLRVATDAPALLCAADQDLYVLLENLLDNAVRYTPCDGQVLLSVRRDAGRVILEVADDGPGIPAAERERVLDRFYRRAGTGQTGSGLGLAIAASIVKGYGTRLELHDSPLGAGLAVSVSFPRAK